MAEQSAPGESKRRLPLLVILPLITLPVGAGLGVGVAWYLGLMDKGGSVAEASEAAPTADGEGEGDSDAAPSTGEHGETPSAVEGPGRIITPDGTAVTSLGTFTVNLRGSGGGRVLRLEVQVEGRSKDSEEIAARLARIRDSVITGASDYTWAELEGTDGKTRLRDELMARVSGAAAPAVIEHIYFTQFVVQ